MNEYLVKKLVYCKKVTSPSPADKEVIQTPNKDTTIFGLKATTINPQADNTIQKVILALKQYFFLEKFNKFFTCQRMEKRAQKFSLQNLE